MPASATQGVHNKCSAVAEIGDRLATIDMDRKLGGLCPFGGELDTSVPVLICLDSSDLPN